MSSNPSSRALLVSHCIPCYQVLTLLLVSRMSQALSTLLVVDRHVLRCIAEYLSRFPFDMTDEDNFYTVVKVGKLRRLL